MKNDKNYFEYTKQSWDNLSVIIPITNIRTLGLRVAKNLLLPSANSSHAYTFQFIHIISFYIIVYVQIT